MATTFALEEACYSSGPTEYMVLPEAASQSFKRGQMVYMGTNAQVTECVSDTTSILGMACGDATGTTNANCTVLLAYPNTVFEMTISGTSDPTFAVDDMCVKCGMLVADNRTYADVDDTDNERFVIRGLKKLADGTNVVGDDYVRGFVTVLPAVFDMGAHAE